MKHTLTELVKQQANFSHYHKGDLYYEIIVDDVKYLFPINTFTYETNEEGELISELGNATLNSKEKGLMLMRYIRKAIDNETISWGFL